MAIFPFWQIALCAGIACVSTLLVVSVFRGWYKLRSIGDLIGLAVVVGCSALLWRDVGNTPALNNDPIPVSSRSKCFQ